jgi:hypothetical protein
MRSKHSHTALNANRREATAAAKAKAAFLEEQATELAETKQLLAETKQLLANSNATLATLFQTYERDTTELEQELFRLQQEKDAEIAATNQRIRVLEGRLLEAQNQLDANTAAAGEGCHEPSSAALQTFAAEFCHHNLAIHNRPSFYRREFLERGGIASNWNGVECHGREQAEKLLRTVLSQKGTDTILSFVDILVGQMAALRSECGANNLLHGHENTGRGNRQIDTWVVATESFNFTIQSLELTIGAQLTDIDTQTRDNPKFAEHLVRQTKLFYEQQLAHVQLSELKPEQLVQVADSAEEKHEKAAAIKSLATELATRKESLQSHSEILQSAIRMSQPEQELPKCTYCLYPSAQMFNFDCCGMTRCCPDCIDSVLEADQKCGCSNPGTTFVPMPNVNTMQNV